MKHVKILLGLCALTALPGMALAEGSSTEISGTEPDRRVTAPTPSETKRQSTKGSSRMDQMQRRGMRRGTGTSTSISTSTFTSTDTNSALYNDDFGQPRVPAPTNSL